MEEILTALGFGAFAAVLAGFAVVFFIVAIAIYIYASWALMTIADKTKTKNGWLAFIPIANVYLMTQIAKLNGWWTLVVLLPIIPVIGGIALLVAVAYFMYKIALLRKFPAWYGPVMVLVNLIPLIGSVIYLVMLGILAWRK